ncbi:hypothetical protein [Candidatus Methylobacter oryzae]|uniref:DUF4398 domain-containing protein n=1 Tax=Candidatus Methylobacter oryzae TaxID=2497749 RepID=A0ABY3CCF9_9GAMM|nr:hypothetical protein [Candidatus Methylobacter oryzae]TRW98985.1 hypothetical protein EKO24_006815 [Candidatus Methylobacter oryzae]
MFKIFLGFIVVLISGVTMAQERESLGSDSLRSDVVEPLKRSAGRAAIDLGYFFKDEILRDTTWGKKQQKNQNVIEDSRKAYSQAVADLADFKARYKKPEECYDMKDRATRIRCANDFMRARKLYEASRQ